MSDEKQSTLSIIVVAFNEARHIARLQRSALALQKPDHVRVETILVDGGSRDGTPEEGWKAGFSKVISLPGANIPVCRNAGAREATGNWLAYVDADCEITPDWLEQALPFLTGLDPVILGWPARPPDPMNWLQAAWNFHWLNKNPHLEDLKGRQVVKHEGSRLATTRNMILHRSVFEAIGGFNENLPTGEDTDFAFRAYMKDIRVLGLPELRMIHHGEPSTLREFFRQQRWHANRRSYRHIRELSGGRIGGNAPRYTTGFTVAFFLMLASLAGYFLTHAAWWLLGVLPLPAVAAGPAAYISLRGHSWKHFPALCLIYFTYGLARMWDLLGFSPDKISWKSPSDTETP